MPTPNIDERGRRARSRGGKIVLALAFLAAVVWPRPWSWSGWTAVLGLAAAGAFMLYEARRSWCALRACGIKTPL